MANHVEITRCRNCRAYRSAAGLWFMPEGGPEGVGEECRRYEIKCDDCKATIGTTDLLAESAAGGRCNECRTPA